MMGIKLKVGDKVGFIASRHSGVNWLTVGKDYTVKAVEGDVSSSLGGQVLEFGFIVTNDDGDDNYCLSNGHCAHGGWELVTD